jgi:hypothetical protein
MKSYDQWINESKKEEETKYDAAGGIVPENFKTAKKVDLITLPKSVSGTNCFNCVWVKDKKGKIRFCDNPKVKEDVNERMCCAEWDHPDVKRPF